VGQDAAFEEDEIRQLGAGLGISLRKEGQGVLLH
jgi:hypothetical protein